MSELARTGFLRTHIRIPLDVERHLLEQPKASKETWEKFPINITGRLLEDCMLPVSSDKTLSDFIPYIKTFGYIFKDGHQLIPHSDMSPFSPWLAQLFYVPPGSSLDLLIGNKDTYKSYKVSSGDLFFFDTYPSDLVCATSITKGNVYIINFLLFFGDSLDDNWVFRDAEVSWKI